MNDIHEYNQLKMDLNAMYAQIEAVDSKSDESRELWKQAFVIMDKMEELEVILKAAAPEPHTVKMSKEFLSSDLDRLFAEIRKLDPNSPECSHLLSIVHTRINQMDDDEE